VESWWEAFRAANKPPNAVDKMGETIMNTRRTFLAGGAAAAGIIFCGCALQGAAQAQPDALHRLPVSVGGKRVKTIDVHTHCLFHEAAALLGDDAASLTPAVIDSPKAYITIEERTKAMDAMAVDMEVLSINPFWYSKDRDLAAKIVSIQNEKLWRCRNSRPQ
jgi:aminocarboxymuconate-semialdehyde decarboxylase